VERVIAATNRDLDKSVAENRVPRGSLLSPQCDSHPRARLARAPRRHSTAGDHFLKKYAAAANRSILAHEQSSLDALCGYEWPGNVAQLKTQSSAPCA